MTNTQTTNGIKVSVETFYRPENGQTEFLFAYRVTLENQNDFAVQLLNRHWFITDSFAQRREVRGAGVVGEQPIIEPKDCFQYTSGCHFKSEIGKMEGVYEMLHIAYDERFWVQIPTFLMVTPEKLN